MREAYVNLFGAVQVYRFSVLQRQYREKEEATPHCHRLEGQHLLLATLKFELVLAPTGEQPLLRITHNLTLYN